MTREQDIERVLDQWFTEGPTQMPNRFLDDTLDRIDRAPRRRLARLPTRLSTVHPTVRFAGAAAAVLVVAGLGAGILTQAGVIGRPSDGSGLLPASLGAQWSAVGNNTIVISQSTLTVWDNGDLVSEASLAGPGRIELRALSPGGRHWHCNVGDEGEYTFSQSTGDHLTLTPVSDVCPSRSAVLAGDWSRTDLGDLQPGRREAAKFRPFNGGTGRLALTLPAGWAGIDMHEGLFALGRPTVSDQAAIRVISNAYPSAQDAPCSENRGAVGVGRSPAALEAWLRSVQGLVVSTPIAATVGGLGGIVVDVSIAPGWTTTCAAGLYTFSYSGSDDSGWSSRLALKGSGRARYLLLDRGDGSTLVIAIEAPDSDWNAFIADAMPVVESLELTR